MTTKLEIPFWEKYLLTVREACIYFHIGEKKMTELIDIYSGADFILKNGERTMIKKHRFEQFLDRESSI